jgi:hypothetical protein
MRKRFFQLLMFAACCSSVKSQDVSQYNVVWNSQSKNASESMPLGGGDIGCNVWTENNDILFYISRSGTFDENNSFLKLGRVRLSLSPNPFGKTFKQELKLKEGYIEISGENNTVVKLWVEVFKPVIHVEVSSGQKLSAKATFETWRTEDRMLSSEERSQAYSFNSTTPEKFPIFTRKDTVKALPVSLIWYHQNRNDDLVLDKEIVQQHLTSVKDQLWNPLKNLIFGGEMIAKGMTFSKIVDSIYVSTKYRGWVYESSQASKELQMDIVLYTAYSPTAEGWSDSLKQEVKTAAATPQKWLKNSQWWAQFWNRSYICVNTDKKATDDKGWEIGRNYNVFRYQLACNAYGEFPTKFNGGLFTYDSELMNAAPLKSGPDYRRWGGGSFTAQNQRLLYWPMLKSGDFDMMKPQFEFYRRSLGNATLRTKVYWGHEGASFTEQIENFGLPAGHTYERLWGNTTLQPRSDSSSTRVLKDVNGNKKTFIDYGFLTNMWVVDHYDGQLEFSKMILDYQQYTGADIRIYMPLIESSVRFHDEHYQYWSKKLNGYPLDANGKLIMYPGTALETYKDATNATNTIAGMKTVLTGLLALPANYGTAEQRTYWKAVLDRLPDINLNTRELNGHTVVAPAKTWTNKVINTEIPQLYPLFPYRLFGFGRPDLQLYIDTWHFGAENKNQYAVPAWHPDAIYAADLGLVDEAKALIIKKMSSSKSRFPTFWESGDWGPDHNWGGVGLIALQEMVMQEVGDKIYLLPAWPKDWNAQFKLHAAKNTVIEGTIRNGEVLNLKVTPAARAKDVEVVKR